MRQFKFLLAGTVILALLACASPPPAPAEPKRVKLDASNIAEAQAAGYKIVTRNGQRLYCRKDLVTGSHLQTQTVCLTEQERDALNDDTRRNVSEMSRQVLPKPGQ